MSRIALVLLTIVVMVAFATNSVIGRAALKSDASLLIDPATYTTVRVVFGAFVLALVQWFRRRSGNTVAADAKADQRSAWLPALALVLYAVAFSFAYVGLDTASGTLILFAFVQITMFVIAAAKGERPRSIEVVGLLIASAGLVYLLFPDLKDSRLALESGMMMVSGIGWGIYSVLGKGSNDPIGDTARNFARSVPFVVVVSLLAVSQLTLTGKGFWLAAASGGLTSGLGYVLWYIVLPKLRSTQAAVVQLSVPIVAAIGGVLFAGDEITQRAILAGVLILSGIGLTVNWDRELGPASK
jgi:drug/metabolite transporter (DMT)-like permease